MTESTGKPGNLLRETLGLVAPGTVLRDGLERILRGRTGAIIVLGYDEMVESISSGGFNLDVELSAARLRELAKMDGAVVVDRTAGRIRRANVQLLPHASIETAEAGMRHRTAERVARQTGYPVISVSQSMRIISLYVDGRRHVIEPSEAILARANQALATLERYKARLNETSAGLDALEIEDLVTVRRSPRCSSCSRWSAASPRTSTATSSSSAPTGGCSPSSSRSSRADSWPSGTSS